MLSWQGDIIKFDGISVEAKEVTFSQHPPYGCCAPSGAAGVFGNGLMCARGVVTGPQLAQAVADCRTQPRSLRWGGPSASKAGKQNYRKFFELSASALRGIASDTSNASFSVAQLYAPSCLSSPPHLHAFTLPLLSPHCAAGTKTTTPRSRVMS